ncbi:hypothetical protein GCM10027317_00770 [Massilia agri]
MLAPTAGFGQKQTYKIMVEYGTRSVADIEGPWVEPAFESSLIQRCRENWSIPIHQVTNHVLATFLRQRAGLSLVVPEANRRIMAQYCDGSEMYDEELSVALADLA